MGFEGADTEQLREQSRRIDGAAVRIEDLLSTLNGVVSGVEWTGPDAEAFRERWSGDGLPSCDDSVTMLRARGRALEEDAAELDRASDEDGGGGGSPWDRIIDMLQEDSGSESDGFFGDLLGGPESGTLGTIGWNLVGMGMDIPGMIPGLGLPWTIAGIATDSLSMGIGMYDMAQSFQDGDLFGTIDGAVTVGINGLDLTAGVLSVIPYTAPAGEIAGIFTSGADALWSGATIAAQMDAIQGGEHGGSTSRFLLESMGVDSGLLDSANSRFGQGSEFIRDQVPFIDPILDAQQGLVQSVIPQNAQESIEGGAEWVNDRIDQYVPWFR